MASIKWEEQKAFHSNRIFTWICVKKRSWELWPTCNRWPGCISVAVTTGTVQYINQVRQQLSDPCMEMELWGSVKKRSCWCSYQHILQIVRVIMWKRRQQEENVHSSETVSLTDTKLVNNGTNTISLTLTPSLPGITNLPRVVARRRRVAAHLTDTHTNTEKVSLRTEK